MWPWRSLFLALSALSQEELLPDQIYVRYINRVWTPNPTHSKTYLSHPSIDIRPSNWFHFTLKMCDYWWFKLEGKSEYLYEPVNSVVDSDRVVARVDAVASKRSVIRLWLTLDSQRLIPALDGEPWAYLTAAFMPQQGAPMCITWDLCCQYSASWTGKKWKFYRKIPPSFLAFFRWRPHPGGEQWQLGKWW